jgi:hypothetical protein
MPTLTLGTIVRHPGHVGACTVRNIARDHWTKQPTRVDIVASVNGRLVIQSVHARDLTVVEQIEVA